MACILCHQLSLPISKHTFLGSSKLTVFFDDEASTICFSPLAFTAFESFLASWIFLILDKKSKVPPLATVPVGSGRGGATRGRMSTFGRVILCRTRFGFSESPTFSANFTCFFAFSVALTPSLTRIPTTGLLSRCVGASAARGSGSPTVSTDSTDAFTASSVLGCGTTPSAVGFGSSWTTAGAGGACFSFHSSARKSFSGTRLHERAHFKIHSGHTMKTPGAPRA